MTNVWDRPKLAVAPAKAGAAVGLRGHR
ncbi:protein of unknown function [uncultured Sphingopyxis sp.]|uniref:Uncharacterized protein n=1 Tax=uncultured Sphingopyxis sp. TaxID=310581 RepID=A0A1Y5Q0G3_9SPHN|nr:protein of unknown function [uncultured Sphingopyxis sp.]